MKRNILYIHTHDSGRYLEPYGYHVPAPHLMNLAKEGTLFRNAYCAGPTCSPSRVGLLTGMAPHSSGMLGLAQRGFQMADYRFHLSKFLLDQGYHTALFGVQHEAPDSALLYYEHVYDRDCHHSRFIERDTAASEHAAQYLMQYQDERPFFMSVGLINTHRTFPEGAKEHYNADYVMPPFTIPDNRKNREDMAAYMNSARIADECVGRVLSALRQSGREDETIILFTTDHGIAFPYMKCNGYDTGIGVALMMKFKGNPAAGKATDALISQIDIFPTLCELNGLEIPDYIQGKSFAQVFDDPEAEVNEQIYSEITYHAAYEPMRCIRTDRYKLIKYYDYHHGYVPANIDASPGKDALIEQGLLQMNREREMLFDLTLDPMERTNLVNHPLYQEIYSDMVLRLDAWMRRTDDPLLQYTYRVPKPEQAFVNRRQDLDPNCEISE